MGDRPPEKRFPSVSDEFRIGETHGRNADDSHLLGIVSDGLYVGHGIDHVTHQEGVVDGLHDLTLPDDVTAPDVQSEPSGELICLRPSELLHQDTVVRL